METALEVFRGNTFYFDWEVTLQEWLQGMISSEMGTKIVSLITLFGEELVMITVLGFLYWCYDKNFGRFVGTNILLGIVVTPMLKNIAFRRRPYFDHSGIKILKPVDASADIYDISAQGYSFPSGHSTNATVLYSSLAMYKLLKSASTLSYMIRTARYAIIIFILIGVYPMIFDRIKKQK